MKIVENKAAAAAYVINGGKGDAFEFALERDPGRTYELPLIQDLPVRQVRKLSHIADSESAVDDIFEILDELVPDFMDVATQREVSLVMDAWSEASRISTGE